MRVTELYKPPRNPVQKNGFEKIGWSICMESPPTGTPTRVFCVRARLTTASGHAGTNLRGCAHANGAKWLIFNNLRLSLCAKVKPYGFTPMRLYVGAQARAWAVVRPSQNPNFLRKLPLTHGLPPTPTFAPKCATVRP